jgi:hypothetical protein
MTESYLLLFHIKKKFKTLKENSRDLDRRRIIDEAFLVVLRYGCSTGGIYAHNIESDD